MPDKIEYRETIFIAAPVSEIWHALIESEIVEKYHFLPLRKIEMKVGGVIEYGAAEKVMISGKIIELEERVKLVHTFTFSPEMGGIKDDPVTTVDYSLEDKDGGTMLTLIHSGFLKQDQSYANITDGWPHILKGLAKLFSGRN